MPDTSSVSDNGRLNYSVQGVRHLKESVNLMHPDDLEYLLLYLIPRIRNCASFATVREWRDFITDLQTALSIAKAQIESLEQSAREDLKHRTTPSKFLVLVAPKMQKRRCFICRQRVLKGELYRSQPNVTGRIEHFGCYLERLTGYAVADGRACFWPKREMG